MGDAALLVAGEKYDIALIAAGKEHLSSGSYSTPLFVNGSHFMEALKSLSNQVG